MCSTRSRSIALALLAGATIAGCQRAYVETPTPLTPEPMAADEAMKIRQWAPTSAMYPNGAVDAGATGFAFEPVRGEPEYKYYYTDLSIYFGNLLLLPIRLIQTPPTRTLTFRGEWILPTYTANPPLPEESVPAEKMDEPEAPAEPADEVVPVPSDSPATMPS